MLPPTERQGNAGGSPSGARVRKAVAALTYLKNPYDEKFDFHVDVGFDDDIEVVREAHRAVFGRGNARS